MTAFWQGPSPWFGMDQPSWDAGPANDDAGPLAARESETDSAAAQDAQRPEGDDFVRHSIQRSFR